jgi:acyl-CoA reductase-like NAD-dependent aldehyde dehydrogenase
MSDILRVHSPWTGEVVSELAIDSPESIDRKVQAAAKAQKQWMRTSLTDRRALIEVFLEVAEQEKQDVARFISAEMGKPVREALGEMNTVFGRARTMLTLAEKGLADDVIDVDDGIARKIVRDPLGVIVDVAAWNYPLLIASNVIIPGLLAGNAVVLKHASQTPSVGVWFEEAFRRAGAPEGLVTAVTVPGRKARVLLEHPLVDSVFFTGSVSAGRQVYRTVANRSHGFLDVGLELGGKDPAYVRADMDLDIAASNLVEGAFYNAGQSCCAVERIYVDRSCYAAFVDRYVKEASRWVVGDPSVNGTIMGPVASAETLDVLDAQVADAVSKGAKLMLGGKRLEGPGWKYPATVLIDCDHSMDVMREESFGPIIGLMAVDGDEEAVEQMNDTAFGLTASIWTADHEEGSRLARHVSAGTVYVNRCDYVDPSLPWTGFRDSGKGISLSSLAYHHLTRARGIHVRGLDRLR